MKGEIPLEKTIVNDIMKWLREHGYGFVHKTHGSAYAVAGVPDIIVIDHLGRFVGLECKRPKIGRLTALQARTLNQINEARGYAVVVTSVEDAVEAMLKSETGVVVLKKFKGE